MPNSMDPDFHAVYRHSRLLRGYRFTDFRSAGTWVLKHYAAMAIQHFDAACGYWRPVNRLYLSHCRNDRNASHKFIMTIETSLIAGTGFNPLITVLRDVRFCQRRRMSGYFTEGEKYRVLKPPEFPRPLLSY